MKFYFHPRADHELDDTVSYYEECQTGLGMEFAEEVYVTIARIMEYPEAWPSISKNTKGIFKLIPLSLTITGLTIS